MSKRLIAIISLVVVVAMLCSIALVACNDSNPDDGKVTVTWYDGSSELRVDKVAKGSTVSSWTPEKAGHTFLGWYAEASKTEVFDFNTIINEDTDIFAAFRSDVYVEDTTVYYLIGSGSGDMKASNWDHTASEASLAFTKDETVTNANIYTITITMYAGDGFQICHDGSWDGQQGIGHMIGAEYCDGVNKYDGQEYTAADKKVAQVKNEQGEVVFVGSDEYDKGFEVWNIFVTEGHDGVYKFTYTTYPGQAGNNTLSFELVQALEPLAVTHDMYFIGTMNGWAEDFTETPELHLTQSEDKATWTGILTITEEDYAEWTLENPANPFVDNDGNPVACAVFQVYNLIDDQYYGIDGNIFVQAGNYIVTYTVETNEVTVKAEDPAYYVVGTFLGEEDKVVNFSIDREVSPVLSYNANTGLYNATFTVADVSGNSAFSWLATQDKGIFAIKCVYGTSAKIDNWYAYTADGDNFYFDHAGVYTVEFNPETGAFTVTEETPAYYVTGTLVDAEGNAKGWSIYHGISPVLTLNSETGLYEVVINVTDVSGLSDYSWLGASGIFAIKVVKGVPGAVSDWYSSAVTEDNHVFATAGSYRVILDPEAGTFTVVEA